MNHLPWWGIVWRLLVPFAVAAQSVTVTDVPASVDQTGEISVSVSVSCAGCGDSYLRGVFFPSGNSYFGYTQDRIGTWSNAPGSGCKTYFAVLQADLSSEGTWSGILRVKPDRESGNYSGPGEYLFKVGRYTASCNSPSSGGWSAESIIAITGPTHTPTPIPTQTPAPTAIPSPQPTSTPTPTLPPVPTVTPTVSPSPWPTEDSDILGIQSAATDAARDTISRVETDAASVSARQPDRRPVFSLLIIGTGMGILAAVTAWQKTDVWKTLLGRQKHGHQRDS